MLRVSLSRNVRKTLVFHKLSLPCYMPSPHQLLAQTGFIMCGSDTSTTVRVGARVDLFSESQCLGSLLFLDPSSPGSTVATHVRFAAACGDSGQVRSQLVVSIQ